MKRDVKDAQFDGYYCRKATQHGVSAKAHLHYLR